VGQTVRVLRNAPQAVKRAVAELDNPEPDQRKNALISLSQIAHPTAQQALAAAVRHPIEEVRIYAALMLVKFKDPQAVPGLIEASHYTSFPIGEVVVRTVTEPLRRDHMAQFAALAKSDGKLPQADWSVSDTAEWALIQFGAEAVDGLLQALHSPDTIVCESAKRILPRIQDSAVVNGLVEDLQSANKTIRLQAILMLSVMHDIEASEPYLIKLLDDEDLGMQMAAQFVLGGIDTEEARKAVQRWKTRQTTTPQRTREQILEDARDWLESTKIDVTQSEDEFIRIEFQDDAPSKSGKVHGTNSPEVGPPVPKSYPKKQATRDKWKQAYQIIVDLRKRYRDAYDDLAIEDPTPTDKDYAAAIADGMNWSLTERHVYNIKTAGDRGLLD
jgi:hypothetical protein